ncbi:unnamed protein product [Schistosoma guineensis]|nr:unnamed protein product [Schistosoma guineensis]
MKLTICFGDTKVVVPCGSGNLTLGPQDRIVVHSINVARDGGMLDWDDLVCDVVDDREMVTAHFSVATLSNNIKDSCPNRPSTALDSIFQSLSTPLVVDLCSDSAIEPSFHSPIQSSGASEFRDSGLNLAPPCGIGLRQTDINGHIADRLLRIGDGSTSSSNLSLNLSNDSCGLHQPNGAHTSQFLGDIHEWLLNESSHDSNAALHPNIKVNCVSEVSSSGNKEKCFTTSSASQSPPTCFNTVSSTCERLKSSPVSCNKSCSNSITINDTAISKHCQRTLSPNVFEMLSNVLSRRRDLIESGWDSDDEDEDAFDPDGGYSYDCQVGEQQNELVSLPNGDTILHSDTINNNSDIIPNSLPGGNHCCLDVTGSNSHHENTNDNFSTVRYPSVTLTPSGTCDRPSNHPVLSNADIWPLPPPPFSASDFPHVNIPTNLPCRVHSPEDEYHIGINTERLIRAVQSHNSFPSSNGSDRFCTTSDIVSNSLVSQSELRNPLSYSQPNLVTQYDDSIRQQNMQHLSNTHIAENNMVSNSLHQSRPDHVQSQYSHTCNINSAKSLVITSRPVGGLSYSRTTTRLGTVFQSNLTVPTIVEEEEEYSVDSERQLPNLLEYETEHQFIDMLKSRTNPVLNNNIDINEANEEDYPLLRKDYVLEKDQTSVQKCGVLHVNTINNDKCNPSSNELHLSNLQFHSNDNPLITNTHSIRGLPKPDVIRWLENTRDAAMSNNCQVISKSGLSHLSSSASLNQSDFNDHQPINEVPEKISLNIIESPSVNKSQESINSKDSVVTIRLINTKRGENLGIQIKPVFSDVFNNDNCSDNNGGSRIECGLEVHCILPNGRVAREQCLSVGDRILSINGISLSGIPFEKGRDIFQEALNEPEIILRVLPHSAYQYSSSLSIQNIDKINRTTTEKSEKPSCGLIVIVSDPLSKAKEVEIKSNSNQLKPIPPPPPRRSPNTVLTRIPEGIIKPLIDEFLKEKKQQENNNNQLPSSQELTKSVVNSETNIVNNSDDLHTFTYHTIHLCKGSNGLGFSLTSRDSLTSSGQKVICVKNILPGGAALIDGQLKPGDLLMKVDNIDVNEIGQAQTVALLRSKPVNTFVTLVVKRSRNNSHNADINNNSNNNNNDHNLDQACLPDLKTIQPSVICTIASSCCINTVNEQPTKSILSSISSLPSTSQPITQQHNERVIVEQPSSHDIKIPDKLPEWNCCSSDISQKLHPLPPSHPSYKLHEIDSSHWSIYLLNIHLPLTKVNESDKITKIRQYTDSTVHQSTVKRYTGNPVTLGVSVSVRRLSNNLCVNSNDALGGGLSSSTTATANTTVTVNEKHPSVQIDKTNDSQWNAVFVRTVIDGGPAYQDGRLQVGDRLLTIDDQNLSGLSTTDALNRLKSVIAKDLNESPHPCVHLLIARPRDGIDPDNSYTNSMENKSENAMNKITSSNQRKSFSEVATNESHNDNSANSKPLLVSAVVHSSESVSMAGGNSHDSYNPPGKYSLSSNHLAVTNLSPSSSSQHLQSQKQSTNLSNTSYPLCLIQNSQSSEEMSKTLHLKSNTYNSTVNVDNFYANTTKSASSSLLICNTKTNENNDENIDVNRTNHHDDANNCNTVTNSLIINNSFQCDSKTVNIDYCAVKKVQIPVTSCSTLKHLDSIPSSNSNGTSEHSHHHYRRRHHYRDNEKFYLNSKSCYSNLDQDSKKRLSNYSSSSTEILCNYQHNLCKYRSNDNIVIDDNHDSDDDMDRDKSSMICYQYLTDDSDLNYDATPPLSDPETERYSYKLDLLSELSLSSVSGAAGDQILNMNIQKNPITNKSTLHKCYYTHGKYLIDKKCKYRVVYRQPRIDFSQMVLVPFDPASWNGPVLKPRTALNSEELQLIVDMPNSFSSLQNNNNHVEQQPDKNIERRGHDSVVDVDSMCNKQNAKCIDNETVRVRKTHPKTVISKLFSLVKTTTHRRTIGDQNTISDFENNTESQLPTDDNVQTILSSANVNDIEKRNNCLINLQNNTNTLSAMQNNLYVESSAKNLLKPQSDQSIDLQLCANNKITNPIEKSSRSSCYATLHERLEPPIHIYDTAHNIQINNTNDHKSDLSNPSNEQVTLLDAKYPSSFAPQSNIIQTTTENVVVNQPEDTSLTQLQTTKYADLSFLPNSSLNSPLSCMPLLLTDTTSQSLHKPLLIIKELTSQQQQQSQHRSISSNQHHLTSLSKSAVNRLYDIEISSCSTAYESVMEYTPTCDDVTSKQKTTREVYEDAEVLYRHLSDLKQSNNSDIQTTVIDSSHYH